MSSMVMSVDHPGLTFNLTLVRTEPTYNQPVQQWTFLSDFAVRGRVVFIIPWLGQYETHWVLTLSIIALLQKC